MKQLVYFTTFTLLSLIASAPANAEVILYGVTGGFQHSSTPGTLYQIDPANGDTTLIGTPIPNAGLTGLVHMNGRLIATTNVRDGYRLIEMDPNTGALAGVLADITYRGQSAGITDLAYNSQTNKLYGIGSGLPIGGNDTLVEINPATGEATLVGVTGMNGGFVSIGFSPDGRLYGIANFGGAIREIDQTNGNLIGAAPLGSAIGALGMDIHPETGDAFFTRGRAPWGNALYNVDPSAGFASFIGGLGDNAFHDLAFVQVPVPEPASLALWSLASVAGIGFLRRRRR